MLFELLALGCAAPEPPMSGVTSPAVASTMYSENVSLYGKNVNDAVVANMLDDHPGGIVDLSVVNSNITNTALLLILTSPKTTTLRRLDVQGNPLTNDALVMLAESSRLKNLTSLHISYAGLSAPGFVAFASSPHHGALRYLAASFQPIGDEGAEAIARIPGLGVFRGEDSSIGPAGARALLSMPTLTNLTLDRNPLGAGALVGLNVVGPKVVGLSFAKTGLGAEDVATLLRLAPETLLHIDLTDCPIGDEGITLLTEWPHLSRLRSLSVPRSGAGPAALAALRAAWGDRAGLTAGRP